MKTTAQIVKESKSVKFKYYRENALWYSTDTGFVFPVPTDDIGSATFLAEDKPLFFMRWIRKYNDAIRNSYTGST